MQMYSFASQGNDRELQQMLVQKSVDINHVEAQLHTSMLLCAVSGHHLSTVKLLLDAGVNNNIYTALSSAVVQEDTEIVKLLLKHGAHLHERYLGSVSYTHNTELIKTLLATGVNPKFLLDLAAHTGNQQLVQSSLNALKDETSKNGVNIAVEIKHAMLIANKAGHKDIVKILDEDSSRSKHK